jgi:hypothetical protein
MMIDAAVDYLPSPMDVNGGKVIVMDVDEKEKTEEIAI